MSTETKTLSDSPLEVQVYEPPCLREHPQDMFPYIQSVPFQSKDRLKVAVLFTDCEATCEAMKTACAFAVRLNAIIEVVATEVVPYPIPLDSPPSVFFRCLIRGFEASLNEYPVKTELQVFLCRDQVKALNCILRPNSPVLMVIGKSNPNQDEKLARTLRHAGYDVIEVDS